MFGLRNKVAIAGVAASLAAAGAAGGVVGALLASSGSAASAIALAASTSPSPTNSSATGKFVPNEDPTHEQGESAAREAQENAGQVPTVP